MIRINLHPVRQIKKVQAGRRQLFILAFVIIGELAFMAFLYSWKSGIVEERRAESKRLNQRIVQLKKEVGDFDQLKQQRERLLSQRNIINTLQKARTGPVWMMQELSDILTQGKGPTVNQQQYEELQRRDPTAGYNPKWNPNRLWIDSYLEKGRMVRISGKAKDYDDVAEFSKRMHLSTFFSNDRLVNNSQIRDSKLKLKVVKFDMTCRVTY